MKAHVMANPKKIENHDQILAYVAFGVANSAQQLLCFEAHIYKINIDTNKNNEQNDFEDEISQPISRVITERILYDNDDEKECNVSDRD